MSDHAIANAKGWLATIRELVAKMNAAEGGHDDGEARNEIEESALSVQVRDGWRSPGGESLGPEEYEILLSTGGPALRIYGHLGDYNEPDPDSLELQYQDWFVPWADLELSDEERADVLAFASCFYFGEA